MTSADTQSCTAKMAQPEPEVVGPTDEELLALVPRGSSESDFYLPKGLPSDWDDNDFIVAPKAVIAFARSVLARWGRPARVPVEGEVAELVAWLRNMANADLGGIDELNADRAADLLQRQAAPCSLPRPTVRRGAMADLSPAAQVVLDAAKEAYWLWDQMCPAEPETIAAAALRAAADLERSNPWGARIECVGAMWMRDQLLAIAAELEGAQPTRSTH